MTVPTYVCLCCNKEKGDIAMCFNLYIALLKIEHSYDVNVFKEINISI